MFQYYDIMIWLSHCLCNICCSTVMRWWWFVVYSPWSLTQTVENIWQVNLCDKGGAGSIRFNQYMNRCGVRNQFYHFSYLWTTPRHFKDILSAFTEADQDVCGSSWNSLYKELIWNAPAAHVCLLQIFSRATHGVQLRTIQRGFQW